MAGELQVGHAASYGEPWKIRESKAPADYRPRYELYVAANEGKEHLASFAPSGAEHMKRAVECVAALAGVADPAAAIQAAREALAEAAKGKEVRREDL